MLRKLTCLILAGMAFPLTSARAQAPNAAEAKLRENLRAAMLQARTLQGERDALQAAKTQLEAEKKTAEEQAAKLQKQIAADKEAADKQIAELHDKSAAQAEQIAGTKASLEKWKASHAEVTGVAQKKEAERAKLAIEKIELQRIVADQRTRNLGMYRVGKEILDRYEKFGLGTALAAREPFTGTMRVKLENLVQDLGDKLAEQRIKPEPAAKTDAASKPDGAGRPDPAAAEPAKPSKTKADPAKPTSPKPAERKSESGKRKTA